MHRITVVAWDFDGVLNRNIVDGQFLWSKDFESDLGQSLSVFRRHIFEAGVDDIITGKEDLRDRVESWSEAVGFDQGPDALLGYWFEKDRFLDASMLETMHALSERGIRQVIATNQETRRVDYIENEMGYAARVEHIFSSGRMGVRKPEPAFFRQITDTLNVEPQHMLLVDDTQANAAEAARLGWQSIHFTENSSSSFRRQLFELLELV